MNITKPFESDLMLESIKTGIEICVIFPDGKTGSVYTVGEFSGIHQKFRLIHGDKSIGLIPVDGMGYYAMQRVKFTRPHFFYSANPLHLDIARNNIKQAVDKQNKINENLKQLRIEIANLLNKYNASIDVFQTSGDDQGVEFELYISIGQNSIEFDQV